jgi:hypothetical protein
MSDLSIITKTTANKIATTTWLGNHLLPSKYTNGLSVDDKISDISVKYVMTGAGKSWTFTIYYRFSHVQENYSVFTGDTPMSNMPSIDVSPYFEMMRNLSKALFIPVGTQIKTTDDILNNGYIIIYESVASASLRPGSIVSWNNLIGFSITKSIVTVGRNDRYNSGGLMFGNNYPGGTSPTGQLISGVSDYDYHAIKTTEYYSMFGLTQANEKCIKETDTSNIKKHYISPVIGRMYSTYTSHSSNTPIISADRTSTRKIIPPYTLGYWYYDNQKKYQMRNYNPYNACVFETPADKAAFTNVVIYYGYDKQSDKCTFNNVFLHNSSTTALNIMYDRGALTNSVTWKHIYYEGCQYNVAANDNRIKTLDISEIDRLYIYKPQVGNSKTINPYVAPSIFNTSDSNFNSISKIKTFELLVDDIIEAGNYYHPTLTTTKLYSSSYAGPKLECTSVIKSVPVIHVPSAIVCDSTSNNPVRSLSFDTGTKKLTVYFNNISCIFYDAAYANNTSNCSVINSTAVSDTNSLISDLKKAVYEVWVGFTDGYNNYQTYKAGEITGLYSFQKGTKAGLSVTGTASSTSKSYNLKNLKNQTYYCGISVYLYMKSAGTEHLLYGSPTTAYRTASNYKSYSMGNSVNIQGDTPPNPSGAAVAMEIGTYDEINE